MNYKVRLTGFQAAGEGVMPEEFVQYIAVTATGNLFPCVWDEGTAAQKHALEGAFYDGMGGHAAIEDYIVAWKSLEDDTGIEIIQIGDEAERADAESGSEDYEVCFEGFHEVNEETAKELEGYTPYLCICKSGSLMLGFWEDWYDKGKGGFSDGNGGHFSPDPDFIVAWKPILNGEEAEPGITVRRS